MSDSPTASQILSARLDTITDPGQEIRSIIEGPELLLVRTDSGATGVAMRPDTDLPDVVGESAYAIARQGADSGAVGDRAIGLAALNAIDPPEHARDGLDPFRSLDPAVDNVAMVGFFGPVLKHLDAGHVDVFERNPAQLEIPEEKTEGLSLSLYSPDEANAVMPNAEVVFVTGSTLVWGGIGAYLDATTDEQTVVVVGASSSFDPRPLFDAGVSVVAGATARDSTALQTAITDGRCESDLHEIGLDKWASVNPDHDDVAGLLLD